MIFYQGVYYAIVTILFINVISISSYELYKRLLNRMHSYFVTMIKFKHFVLLLLRSLSIQFIS
jgi:hypothetical protein